MTALFRPKVIAVLGDSLSAGASTGLVHSWHAQLDIHPLLFPRLSFANSAKSGDTSELVQTRFTNNVKGQGFDGFQLVIGVNNFNVEDETAAVAYASTLALINDILTEGKPLLVCFEAGWSGYVNWTAGKQANYVAFGALLAATPGVTFLSFYPPYPLGLSDPAHPTAVYPSFDWGDGLHWNQAGNNQVVALSAPKWAAIFPEDVAGETVNVFGVTPNNLYSRHFSQWAAPTTESNPPVDRVTEIINEAAAELEARLLQESVVASQLIDSTKAAYLWCRQTLRLMCALQVVEEATQMATPLAKDWLAALDARLEDLAEKGFLALGGGVSAPAEEPDGPTTFIDHLGLDTSANDQRASRVDAPFHKDDLL